MAEMLDPSDTSGCKLRVGPGGGLPIAGSPAQAARMENPRRLAPSELFLAGDPRVNSHPGLVFLTDLLHREHNDECERLSSSPSTLPNVSRFESARAWVIAVVQSVTVREFFPNLSGGAFTPYAGFSGAVSPAVTAGFVVASRLVPSMIGRRVPLWDEAGEQAAGDALSRDVSYRPMLAWRGFSFEPLLRGMAFNPCQAVDPAVVDDERNFFGGSFLATGTVAGVDAAADGIQRGRDLGLTNVNAMRSSLGLPPLNSLAGLTTSAATQARLIAAYGAVGALARVDAWTGAVAETFTFGSVGPTISTAFRDQLTRSLTSDMYHFRCNLTNGTLDEGQQLRIPSVNLKGLLTHHYPRVELAESFSPQRVPGSPLDPLGPYVPAPAPGVGDRLLAGSAELIARELRVRWFVDPDAGEIEITLGCAGVGWCAFGFGTGMMSGDVIIGSVDNDGNVTVTRRSATRYGSPRVFAVQNLKVIGGSQAGGVTTFTVRRPLSANITAGEIPVVQDAPNSVMFAMNLVDDVIQFHSLRRGVRSLAIYSSSPALPVMPSASKISPRVIAAAVGGSMCLTVVGILTALWVMRRQHRKQLVSAVSLALDDAAAAQRLKQLWRISSKELVLQDEVLGIGAFGQVKLGVFRGVQVAVKQIRRDQLSPELIKGFEEEIELMSELRHPNILTLLGAVTDEPERLCLLTEVMPRGCLFDLLGNRLLTLSQDTLIRFAFDAARGLLSLHAIPIVHGDVKTLNMLVDENWRVKLSDFGMSKIKASTVAARNNIDAPTAVRVRSSGGPLPTREAEDPVSAWSDSAPPGVQAPAALAPLSIKWSAPEVLSGRPTTARSDVYSFGVCLWEIFSRAELYADVDSIYSVAARVADGSLRPDLTLASLARYPGLGPLLARCWDQDPKKRPSMREVLASLETIFASALNSSGMWDGNSTTDGFPAVTREGSSSMIGAGRPAPKGMVTIVFTDIQGSTRMWEADSNLMMEVIQQHNAIMRTCLRMAGGYEVKTEGDSFMIVFQSAAEALTFCVSAQDALLKAPWSAPILAMPGCKEVLGDDGTLLMRGPRVRIGFHSGVVKDHVDPTTGRADYFGPTVNRASRCADASKGGCILATAEAVKDMGTLPESLRRTVTLLPPRAVEAVGIDGAMLVVDIVQVGLEGRHTSQEALKSKASQPAASPTLKLRAAGGAGRGRNPTSAKSPLTSPPAGEEHGGAAARGEEKPHVTELKSLAGVVIGASVGVGSFGEVFDATWNGERVALKRLLRQRISEDTHLRLRAEAFILASVSHPNIMRIKAFSVTAPDMGLITEWLPFCLDTEVRRLDPGVVSKKVGLKWLGQVASALENLHMHSIVHRDLKPANILLDENLNVKICDFGLARIKSASATMSAAGSPAYLAPEVIRGLPTAGFPSDIYSFGLVAIFMFSNTDQRKSWWGIMDPIKLTSKILQGVRPSIPMAMPAEIHEIVTRCIDYDPSRRPMASDLAAFFFKIQNE